MDGTRTLTCKTCATQKEEVVRAHPCPVSMDSHCEGCGRVTSHFVAFGDRVAEEFARRAPGVISREPVHGNGRRGFMLR